MAVRGGAGCSEWLRRGVTYHHHCGVITALPEAGGGAVAGGPGEEVGGLGVWAAVEAAVAATVGGGVAATLHLGSCGL